MCIRDRLYTLYHLTLALLDFTEDGTAETSGFVITLDHGQTAQEVILIQKLLVYLYKAIKALN